MAGALSFSFERRFEGGAVVAAAAELPLDTAPVTVLFGSVRTSVHPRPATKRAAAEIALMFL